MKLREFFRSAISGRFVSKLFARLNPDTTVKERRKETAAELADRLKREADL